MRNYTKQAALTAFAILLFALAGYNGMAQEIPKADNSIHDKMYDLVQKSKPVVLPAEVSQHINTINADNPNKARAAYSQGNALKVLYNKDISKTDKLFFANQMLKNQSAAITAIHAHIRQLLTKL